MLSINTIKEIIIIILTIIILVCSIGIVIAIQFQRKQKKKYKECLRLIKEKETGVLNAVNGLDPNQIKKIDESVDVNRLMLELYDTYLEFINRVNQNDNNFENILCGFINEFYQNKIDTQSSKQQYEIVDGVELLNYSILEYNKQKLKFRINTTCFSYKKKNEEIISGSNLERIEQINLITYINHKDKWLISKIENVYEKKLSM